MLSFSEQKISRSRHKKSPIRFMPDLVNGISAEAPQNFQNPYSLVSKNSYINPYLKFEPNRIKKLAEHQEKLVEPKWTKKVDLHLVEEQKIVNQTDQDKKQSPKSRYEECYHEELKNSPNRFKKIRGEFTNFIEKNLNYKDLGPLQGFQRSMDRIKTTKKEVWMRVNSEHSQNKSRVDQKQEIYHIETVDSKFIRTRNNEARGSSQSDHAIKHIPGSFTSLSKSKLMGEKLRIRNDREEINGKFKQSLELRKKKHPYNFRLPKIQSELLPNFYKQMYARTEQSDLIEDFEGLEKFEITLHKKFK